MKLKSSFRHEPWWIQVLCWIGLILFLGLIGFGIYIELSLKLAAANWFWSH